MAGRESFRTVRDSGARTTNQAAELAEEVERLLLEGREALARAGALREGALRLRKPGTAPLTAREETRQFRRTRGPSDEELREAAQRHLDGRRERLAAYEAALLGARLRPPSRFHVLDYEEIIQQRLAEIRQRIRAAGRPRLSRDWLRAA